MGKNSDFAARLKSARELRGLSKSDVARRVGVTPAAVGNWEAAYTFPRSETYALLNTLLGLEQQTGEVKASAVEPIKTNDSLIEEFKKRLATQIGHPADRINVQVTLT